MSSARMLIKVMYCLYREMTLMFTNRELPFGREALTCSFMIGTFAS